MCSEMELDWVVFKRLFRGHGSRSVVSFSVTLFSRVLTTQWRGSHTKWLSGWKSGGWCGVVVVEDLYLYV